MILRDYIVGVTLVSALALAYRKVPYVRFSLLASYFPCSFSQCAEILPMPKPDTSCMIRLELACLSNHAHLANCVICEI